MDDLCDAGSRSVSGLQLGDFYGWGPPTKNGLVALLVRLVVDYATTSSRVNPSSVLVRRTRTMPVAVVIVSPTLIRIDDGTT